MDTLDDEERKSKIGAVFAVILGILFAGGMYYILFIDTSIEDRMMQLPVCEYDAAEKGIDSETGESGMKRRFFLCKTFVKN